MVRALEERKKRLAKAVEFNKQVSGLQNKENIIRFRSFRKGGKAENHQEILMRTSFLAAAN
jgi:hypothetical protein